MAGRVARIAEAPPFIPAIGQQPAFRASADHVGKAHLVDLGRVGRHRLQLPFQQLVGQFVGVFEPLDAGILDELALRAVEFRQRLVQRGEGFLKR